MIRHIWRAHSLLLGKHGNDVQTSGVGSVLGRQTGATLRVRWEWRGTFIALQVWNHQRDSTMQQPHSPTTLWAKMSNSLLTQIANEPIAWQRRRRLRLKFKAASWMWWTWLLGCKSFRTCWWSTRIFITSQPSLELTKNASRMRIPPASCSCVEEKALVMRGVRGQNGQSGILYLWKMSCLGFRLTVVRYQTLLAIYQWMNEFSLIQNMVWSYMGMDQFTACVTSSSWIRCMAFHLLLYELCSFPRWIYFEKRQLKKNWFLVTLFHCSHDFFLCVRRQSDAFIPAEQPSWTYSKWTRAGLQMAVGVFIRQLNPDHQLWVNYWITSVTEEWCNACKRTSLMSRQIPGGPSGGPDESEGGSSESPPTWRIETVDLRSCLTEARNSQNSHVCAACHCVTRSKRRKVLNLYSILTIAYLQKNAPEKQNFKMNIVLSS